MKNFVEICQMILEILQLSIFKMATIHYLGFSKLVAVWFGRANMHHQTKFHQNQSTSWRDITFNGF